VGPEELKMRIRDKHQEEKQTMTCLWIYSASIIW
jgi:hypothetical protein